MTEQEEYDRAVLLATDAARLLNKENACKKICEGFWAPFQLLYVELAKRKLITSLRDLPDTEKMKYWKRVCAADPKAHKLRKIWCSQAYYAYCLITENKP